jgi:hypothetical protein
MKMIDIHIYTKYLAPLKVLEGPRRGHLHDTLNTSNIDMVLMFINFIFDEFFRIRDFVWSKF